MTKGQICFQHKYCTDCPIRVECDVRPLFYSEEEYNAYKKETLALSTAIAERMGFPKALFPSGFNAGMQMMDKRRKRELELHPTYSVK